MHREPAARDAAGSESSVPAHTDFPSRGRKDSQLMAGGDCGPASFWLGLGKAALVSRDLSRGLKVVQKLAGPCEGTSQTEGAVGAKARRWGLACV